MTTLASAVAIGDNQLEIDTPLTAGQVPGWVKIDSELLNVGGQDNRLGTRLVLSSPATATHADGATVTYAGRPYDAAFLAATAGTGGGGAIAVTDGTTTVEDVTTLQAPSVTDLGGGTVILGPITGSPAAVFYSETDPGAVGAGALWLRWDPGYLLQSLYVRNDADTDWVPAAAAQYGADGTNPTPTVTHFITGAGEDIITYTDAEAEVSILRLPTSPATQLLLRVQDEATEAHVAFTGSPASGSVTGGIELQDELGKIAALSLMTTGATLSSSPDGIAGKTALVDETGLHVGAYGSTPTSAPALTSGDADPSAGGGVVAPTGSLYMRSDGTIYAKTGAGDTAWTALALVP